jgi:hypothetical protein
MIVGPRYNDEDPAVAAAYDAPEEEAMTEHYTDAIVEKAARALHELVTSKQPRDLVFNPAWDDATHDSKRYWIDLARAVLDATAGDIAARALEEAAENLEDFIEAQREHGKAAEAWYDGADEALELLTQSAALDREAPACATRQFTEADHKAIRSVLRNYMADRSALPAATAVLKALAGTEARS